MERYIAMDSLTLTQAKKRYRIHVQKNVNDLSTGETMDNFSVYLPKPFNAPDQGECWVSVSDVSLNLVLPASAESDDAELRTELTAGGERLFPHSRLALTSTLAQPQTYDSFLNGPTSIIATIANIDDFTDVYSSVRNHRGHNQHSVFYNTGDKGRASDTHTRRGFLTTCPFGRRTSFQLIDYANRNALQATERGYLHELSFTLEVEFLE